MKRFIVMLIAAFVVGQATAQTQLTLWHGFTAFLADVFEPMVDEFNAEFDEYHIEYRNLGTYPETMTAAIAAYRAGDAPNIVQMFEVGTATMMGAGEAIVPVYELYERTGVDFDPDIYLAAIRGYYSLPDGRMMSMPFNSSTAITWINNDAFREAGLDPENPPQTWAETREAAQQIVDSGAAPCGLSFAWPTWTQFEQFSAIHDVALASRANGLEGLDAELMIDSDLHVRHVQNLMDMMAEGSFTYGGRDAAGDALFPSGECAILHGSSGLLARVTTEADFDWSVTFLPYYDDVEGAPLNSIIGGTSFWAMTAPGRTDEEYRGVAEFLNFISRPDMVRHWHTTTGFLPIRHGVFEELQAEGYYEENPGLDIPYLQLTRTEPTENSRGLRLGNMPENRNIIQEEFEAALQGEQTAQQAMDNAVQRGNAVLRAFERAQQ